MIHIHNHDRQASTRYKTRTAGAMFYACSPPWPFKVMIFVIVIMRGYAVPDTHGTLSLPLFQACYWSIVTLTLAALLPSLVYSVRCRKTTTSFVSQTMLMGVLVGISMCTLYKHSNESRSYTCMGMLVMCTHFLFMMCRAVCISPLLLNYGTGIRSLSAMACLVLSFVLGVRLPVQPVHGVYTMAVLFSGECLGVVTFIVSETLRACADGLEHFYLLRQN